MTTKRYKKLSFEDGFELLLLGLIFMSILLQLMRGYYNHLSLILRYISVAGMMFLAGYHTPQKASSAKTLFKKGLFYVLLFLLFGLLKQVVIHTNNLFWSTVRLLTLLDIPQPSDIFYTVAVIFFTVSAFKHKLNTVTLKKVSVTLFSILALAVIFIPKTTFDYAILGVFLGTDNYNCIPLLPLIGFFFAGFFASKNEISFQKKYLYTSAAISCVSVILYLTPFKRITPFIMAAMPVYLMFLFVKHCQWYQKLAALPFQLLDSITEKLYHAFFDSYGRVKKTIPIYITLYTFLFCLLSLLVFSPFWASESSLIWTHDTVSQYVPKAYYYMNYIHELFAQFAQGNFSIPTYDFQIGFGNPITFSMEPLYLLLALFPASKVEYAYAFISILRLYFAGLSLSALLLYFKRDHYEALFGSLVYAFSGFALYAVVIHAQFISPMILFPLLIIATEEIFQKNRWYLCTMVVAVSLLSNYYFAYMNTIAIGIYFLTRFIFTKDKNKKTVKYFLSATGLFATSYLLGVVLGNLTLFTSFAAFLGSGRTEGAAISTVSLFSYGKKFLTKFLTSFISPPGNTGFSSKYGFIPFVFIAVVVLFLKRKEKTMNKTLIFLFILYTAFCIFPIAGLVFSGFSVVINRWGFMYALLVAFITACMLPHLRALSKRELGILFAGIIPYVVLIIFNGEDSIESSPFGIIMLLVSYIVILLINENLEIISKKHWKQALLLLCIASILVNSHLQYTIGATRVPDNFVAKGDVLSTIKSTPLRAAEEIEDNSFYRVATTNTDTANINASLVMNYNGINTFSSTVDSSLVDFNTELANSTWSMILYKGFDNRTFLNTLANVKYYTTLEQNKCFVPYGYKFLKEETIDGNTYSIYENEYALPLGYTYTNTISEEELAEYSPIEQQEILLHTASVADTSSSLQTNIAANSTTSEEIEITGYEADNGISISDHEITVTKEGASLTLYFDSLPNAETYIEYTGQCIPEGSARSNTLDFHICRNDTESYPYIMRARENTYTTNQDIFVYNLGYHENSINSCTITFDTLGTLTYDSIKLYSQPMDSYASYVNDLKEDTLENVEMTSNTVTGTISLEEDKLLVMGIPYQNGWTAYVDGKEVKIQKANYMFSGLFLDAGEHTIEFRYELPGIKLSLLLTGIGIIIFIGALIIRKKRQNNS